MGTTLDNKNGNNDEHDEEHGDEEEQTFTQKDIDRVATKARSESRRVTEREILESLGVTDVEEAKALLAKAKAPSSGESGKSKKSDEGDDALTAALAPFQAQLDELRKTTKDDIAELKVTSQVEKALIKAGMSVSAAEKARRLVDVEKNAEDDEIADAIDELKAEMPELFPAKNEGGEEDDEGESRNSRNQSRTPHSNPGSSPRRRKPGKNVQSEARTLLHERHPRLKSKDN